MDIYRLKRLYGKYIRFWGGLGAQHTLLFGTSEEVRKEASRLKTEMARGVGCATGEETHDRIYAQAMGRRVLVEGCCARSGVLALYLSHLHYYLKYLCSSAQEFMLLAP